MESDGTVPQCEVTVQLSTPYNTTGGLVATVLNLIFTNWCAACLRIAALSEACVTAASCAQSDKLCVELSARKCPGSHVVTA